MAFSLLVVTFWLELCTSYSSSCHFHLLHPSCNKIQNGDILLPVYPGCPGKWSLDDHGRRISKSWWFLLLPGWVTTLAEWQQSRGLSVSLIAAKTLANMDVSRSHVRHPYADSVFIYHPVFHGDGYDSSRSYLKCVILTFSFVSPFTLSLSLFQCLYDFR